MNQANIYFNKLRVGQEEAILAASDSDLLYASGFNEDDRDLRIWLDKHYPSNQLVESPEKLSIYTQQFQEYFQGDRRTFDFSIKLTGTPFQLQVWEKLQNIPFGKTTTYSDIAKLIENPQAVRAVGSAIGKNPILIGVPCHRVLNKNGQLGGFRGGIELKQRLLQLELLEKS